MSAWMPDSQTTLIIGLAVLCLALAVALGYEILKARGNAAKLAHIDEHGHAPDGKVLVPEHAVAVEAPPAKFAETPLETLTAMAGGMLKPGWHLERDPVIPQPVPGIQAELAAVGHAGISEPKIAAATAADSANPSRYFWNVGEALGLSGNDLVQFERRCAAAARGNTDPASLTAAAAFAAGSL